MKSILHLAALVACSLSVFCLAGEARGATAQLDEKSAGAAAETFLAGYIKADAKNREWVARSPLVTPEFKAAFKKAMASELVDADPVLFAQDVPSTPFKAESSKVKGDAATVVVVAKYSGKPYRLKVTLVAQGGHWLVSRTAPAK